MSVFLADPEAAARFVVLVEKFIADCAECSPFGALLASAQPGETEWLAFGAFLAYYGKKHGHDRALTMARMCLEMGETVDRLIQRDGPALSLEIIEDEPKKDSPDDA